MKKSILFMVVLAVLAISCRREEPGPSIPKPPSPPIPLEGGMMRRITDGNGNWWELPPDPERCPEGCNLVLDCDVLRGYHTKGEHIAAERAIIAERRQAEMPDRLDAIEEHLNAIEELQMTMAEWILQKGEKKR